MGGHPPPLLVDARGLRTCSPVDGSLVGVFPDASSRSTTAPAAGETLLLYTDGITEAYDGRDWYSDERLLAVAGTADGDAHALVGGPNRTGSWTSKRACLGTTSRFLALTSRPDAAGSGDRSLRGLS